MRTSTAAMGMMGGVGLALSLVAPLYVGLPSNYVNDWMYMTPGGGQAGVVLGGLVLLGTGFLAAALLPSNAIRSGTTASAVAAFVGAVFMLSPGITVEALHDLLRGEPSRSLAETTAEALTRVLWMPHTASLGLMVAGPGLGALGGIAFDLWYAEPSRPVRLVRPSPVPVLGLIANTVWGAVLAYMWWAASDQVVPLGEPPDAIKSSAAPAILGLWTTIFLCWALRDAVVWIRGPSKLYGSLWGLGATALAALTLTPLAYHQPLLTSPAMLAGGVLASLAAVVTLLVAARADTAWDRDPRTVVDVLVESALLGLLTVGLGVLTVGPLALSEYLLINPIVAQLAGDGIESPDPATVVQWVFRYHWFAIVPMAGVAFGWSIARIAGLWIRDATRR